MVLKNCKKSILATALLIAMPLVYAQSYSVRDVRVDGLQRLNAGTVFAQLGGDVKRGNVQDTITRLYETDLFDDVKISQQNGILVITVVERPVIDQVFVKGNKDVATKQFKDMLKMAGFSEGKTYSAAKLASVKNNLLKAYEDRGKYTAKVEANVIELPRNRVNIELNISEGKTAELAEISFTGNENYGDSKLKKQMQIKESGLMTLLTKSDRYDSRRSNEDMDNIEKFYHERGYMKATVNSSVASFTPDQEKIFVDIDVNEGQRYRLTDFEVVGNTHVPLEELTALVDIDKGKYYKKSKVDAAVKAIEDRLGDDGYALARVNAIPDVDDETGTVKILFSVDNGEKVYVRRVNIEGNERTQDEVFRREIRQMEGGQFISSDVERSKVRLQRLPYVEEVEVVTRQVDSDLVDLTYRMKERSAGSITFGLSYGMESKFGFNISFDQPNFMGTGNQLTVSAETDDETKSFNISYTNPYFTDSGISAGVSAHYTKQNNKNGYTADYLMDGYGFAFNFGYPITEYTGIGASIGYDRLNIKTTRDSPIEIVQELGGNCKPNLQYLGYCEGYSNGGDWSRINQKKNLIRFSMGVSRDTRNRTVFASEGSLNSVNISGTLPGSTDEFYKIAVKHSSFYPLFDDDSFVLNIRGDIAKGYAYGKTSGLPFYERYYSGGLRTVRGYRSGTLGPRYLNDQAAGGETQVNATAELIMRVPGFTESNNLRWSIFFDAGQVYGLGDHLRDTAINNDYSKVKTSSLRYSAGVSMAWFSPIGPLVFSYANPMKSKDYDRKQKFQFSVGIPF